MRDEYLEVRFESPGACYRGLQTRNYPMHSTNHADYPVCLNETTVVPKSGETRVGLSARA